MEIQCKECGGKSPMGAIFCRECGAKLDMDDLKPKVVSSSGSGFKLSRYAMRRLFSLSISIVILGILAMMFMDGSPALPDAPNSKGIAYVGHSYKQITAYKGGQRTRKVLTLNPDWISHYYTNLFKENQTAQVGDTTLVLNEAIFDFYDDNKIRMDLRATMTVFDFEREITCTLVLSFENTDSGVDFSVESTAHGQIPLPGNILAENLVYSRFKAMVPADDDLGQIVEQFKSLSITDDGKIVITLK